MILFVMPVKPQAKETHRQRQAIQTRQLILESAQRLFLEQGFGITTIENIADSAGVALSTIYAIYGNKRGILKAMRENWHQSSQAREFYAQTLEQPSLKARIALFAKGTRQQWEHGATMIAIYTSAAAVDSEAASELQSALEGRRRNISQWLEAASNLFQSDLSIKQIIAIYLALTRAELYFELVNVWGWSPDEYERWLTTTLEMQFLPQ
jgi:AcrR family transcriptional regulator